MTKSPTALERAREIAVKILRSGEVIGHSPGTPNQDNTRWYNAMHNGTEEILAALTSAEAERDAALDNWRNDDDLAQRIINVAEEIKAAIKSGGK